MARFELTRFVTSLQKRCFQVEAPDAVTARARVFDGCSHGGVVGREAVLFTTPLDCKEVAATAAPANVKAAIDQDGCPVWVPA
jgi:hypothetical protein